MSSDYGIRAGQVLDVVVPGPHRDKKIARALNVCVRTAQNLRAGQHWTIERLNQASRAFKNFDAFLSDPELVHGYIRDVERQLEEMKTLLGGRDDKQ